MSCALLFLLLANCVASIKIVGVPISGTSHYKTFALMGAELVKRGHEFTMIQYDYERKWEGVNTHVVHTNLSPDTLSQHKLNMDEPLIMMYNFTVDLLNYINASEQILYNAARDARALQYLRDCDLIIGECGQMVATVFGEKYNKPLVSVQSMTISMMRSHLRMHGESYVPDYNSMSTDRLSVGQKIGKYVIGLAVKQFIDRYIYGVYVRLQEKFNVTLAKKNEDVELFIFQYDPLFDWPQPLHPNMFSFGMLTLVEPSKTIAKKYTEFISLHKNGFVLVSFGTIYSLGTDATDFVTDFINALATNTEYGFVVSWKTNATVNFPSNILIDSYVPQNDLLAHPQVRLFVSHVGLLSMVETCYHGVPVIALPRAMDQFDNAFRVQHRMRIGKMFSFHPEKFTTIARAVPEIITDAQIRENAKRCSKVMHSRPVDYGRKRVADLIEELIAWDYDASHLRPYVLDMPWYEYHLLDVLGTVLFMLLLPYVVIRLCRRSN